MSSTAPLRDLLPPPVRRGLRRVVSPSVRMRLSPLPAWRIGVSVGPSPLELHRHPDAVRPVFDEASLRAWGLHLVADPFALHRDGTWYLYFEAVRRGSRRGEVALATSADLRRWEFHGSVLREPLHLSYPCVFEHGGQTWMIPETSADHTVRLYRARRFPDDWVPERVLLRGAAFKDASFFVADGRCWLLVETSRHHTNDELRLYGAETPAGPWSPHPANPLVVGDAAMARPAGAPVRIDGRLYRLAQDCASSYGRGVRAAEITTLTARDYAELPLPAALLGPAEAGWAAGGRHHLAATPTDAGWVCFVDGRP
jgi:hypothetical protein